MRGAQPSLVGRLVRAECDRVVDSCNAPFRGTTRGAAHRRDLQEKQYDFDTRSTLRGRPVTLSLRRDSMVYALWRTRRGAPSGRYGGGCSLPEAGQAERRYERDVPDTKICYVVLVRT